ncbi:SIMPL domain-containing protein [Methylacidimicrobium sp. B4]|uniref:SIMPL domain-containing protein n=1 Tax=Methylacidimicrobium sp. B4 TaxID=2796139 RepID=UPI001A8F3D9F|nr:SIMPL domain-containing protein [Methylacidimicrobium sp. B4]QSR85070.1 SIMPL domain-containing protein [Methylacidimicrobium sp. B4]
MCSRASRAGAVFVALLWIGWAGMGAARAEAVSVESVRVSAEAEESVPIDRAVVEFVLVSEGKTPREAEQKDEARVGEVRKRVDREWGGKGSWRTWEIRLQPVTVEVEEKEKGKKVSKEQRVGYRVTRREAIELAEFLRLGGLLAALFEAAVDEVKEVEWLSDRREALYRRVLAEAMEKAREKAELLAKAAGAQLGPVWSIVEGGEEPYQMYRSVPIMGAAGASLGGVLGGLPSVPVSGGEMKVRASVHAVYRLR